MSTIADLARRYLDVDAKKRAHLRRLLGSWSLLADLSFSDLLLWAPTRDNKNLIVLGQVRPATAQTLYFDDYIGLQQERSERPLVAEVLTTAKITTQTQQRWLPGGQVPVTITVIPVALDGQVIAVVAQEQRSHEGSASGEQLPNRESSLSSELREVYSGLFERLSTMMAEGAFPFRNEDSLTEESPRVGDGTMILDMVGRIVFSSPNAVSALHRIGYHGKIAHQSFDDLGFSSGWVASAYKLKVPIFHEIERGEAATVMCRILPLLEGGTVTGALVLLRDVTDLRSRDRMLVSMNVTLREIHHRVKNNLQVISSLLRIQGRRLESREAKDAIEDAVSRIDSIAVVHDLLASDGGDEVAFDDVLRPILERVTDTVYSAERLIKFKLVGEGPQLHSAKASALAVVVTELLQNAVKHGYPSSSSGGVVTVEMVTSPTELQVRVHDDGVGVADDFDLERDSGLGLTIIKSLISGELDGQIKIRPARDPGSGTLAEVKVSLISDEG